jgi:VWFA-related protein
MDMSQASRSLALLLLAACCNSSAWGGQGSEVRYKEELAVSEVLIDALVTDRRGTIVLGLGEDDFSIEENGKPVEITGVTFYSNRQFLDSAAVAGTLGLDPAEIPVERYFILFFHDQRRGFQRLLSQQLTAARETKKWIQGDLLPNDLVAVVSYDVKLKLHQDFTNDRGGLVAAIDAAATGQDGVGEWPSRQAAARGPSLAEHLPRGRELRKQTPLIYDALRLVSAAAGSIPARKNLVLFSTGFGVVDPFGFYQPDARYYPRMMQALNDNNVAVYPIDLIPAATDHPLRSALSQVAADSSGRYYSLFVSFLTPLEEIARENNGYYLLSYRSEHEAGAVGYQKVEVSTRNPNFVIKARPGYRYGPT